MNKNERKKVGRWKEVTCDRREVELYGRSLSIKEVVIFMEYLDICISAWIKPT